MHLLDQGGGSKQLDAAMRLGQLQRFNLAAGFDYRKQYLAGGAGPPESSASISSAAAASATSACAA